MTIAAAVRSVTEALAEVDRWKADEEARHQAELVEVEQEIKNLETAIDNLKQQLDALLTFKGELEEKASDLPLREVERAHQALFATLQGQADRLAEREKAVAEVIAKRADALAAGLDERGLSAKVVDYQKFRTELEPTLHNIPASYRGAVIAAHEALTADLRAAVTELLSGSAELDAESLQAEIAWCVDAPEGTPELLVVVVPVSDQVHVGWLERDDGLQTWMAARVVQAIYEAAARTDFVRAQAICGGHMSLLAIEVDLEGAPDGFVPAFEERLGGLLVGSAELGGARVALTARSVHVDYILPPGDEGTDEEDVTHA